MLKVRTKGVVNVMGKDQELLEAARNGQVGIVEKILGQRAKRSGPLARWVLRSAVDFNVFIEKKTGFLHNLWLHLLPCYCFVGVDDTYVISVLLQLKQIVLLSKRVNRFV